MAFPVTIDPTMSAPEAPAKYGPYIFGTAIYEVNVDSGSSLLVMKKSTDGGKTWATVDGIDSPGINAFTRFPPACCKSTTESKIFVTYIDSGIGGFAINKFDATTDTWVGATAAPGGVPGMAEYDAISNTVMVIIPTGGVTTYGTLNHNVPAFIRYDVAADTWGSFVLMDWVDYAAPTLWDMAPIGIARHTSDGSFTVFSAQRTKASITTPVKTLPSSPTWLCPGDCSSVYDGTLIGGGGGGNFGGGGGGGGLSHFGTLSTTPGGTYPCAVGDGGTIGIDGGSSSIFGFSAGGGMAADGSGNGGPGGAGDFTGGDGADVGGSGSGGGGSAFTAANGNPGTIGGAVFGGPGGTGTGNGGTGGNAIPPLNGVNGAFPGGGGGGRGGILTHDGDGNGGTIVFFYVPDTATYDGRMWQQTIHADDSLGTLTEITEGEFPFNNIINPDFDCDSQGGFVSICFSGVNATTNANITAGPAADADPLVFTFDTFDAGGGGAQYEAGPAIAGGAKPEVVYKEVPSVSSVTFVRRTFSGSTFGPPSTIGVFDIDGTRIQLPTGRSDIGTFGTPTPAENQYFTPDVVGNQLVIFAAQAGIDGNKINVEISEVAGGGGINVSVTLHDFNRVDIIIQVFTTGGNVNLVDYDGVATAINADPLAAPWIVAIGSSATHSALHFTGEAGFSGAGLTTYFISGGNNNYICMGGELLTQGNFVA